MHHRLLLLLAALLSTALLGCPLDIQVREDPPCTGQDCPSDLSCTQDSNCQEGWRCEQTGQCEQGPRLGEACEGFNCQRFAFCHPVNNRCAYSCANDGDCPRSYRCSPDSLCIAECSGTPPETLGLTCDSSTDCVRCGVCVDSGGTKRCRQPCQRDEDCPGGAPGVCEQVGLVERVCRLP